MEEEKKKYTHTWRYLVNCEVSALDDMTLPSCCIGSTICATFLVLTSAKK